MDQRSATKIELLQAIALGEFHRSSHVLYLPVGAKFFRNMLKILLSSNHVRPVNSNNAHYALTKKGRNYLKRQDADKFQMADAEIDKFVDDL